MENKNDLELILGHDIRKIHAIELGILIEFDRICRKHDIKYQLYSGSLIGAIRHKGFIPWDDDIDVAMLREEYDKLLEVMEEELEDLYFFQSFETDPNYMNKYPKIRKNGTVFLERVVEGLDIHHGVYMDVFIFDSIELDTFRGKYQLWLLRSMDSLFRFRLKKRYLDMEPGFARIMGMIKYYFIKILPISKLRLDCFASKWMKKLNHINTEYVADLGNPSKEIINEFKMKREHMVDSILWEFEGRQFSVPRAFDEVLTQAYGDYFRIPEKSERLMHEDIIKIDLGKFE